MSVKLMTMVFDARGLTSTQKMVMLALADHANEEGRSIYPSVARICDKTALKERVVRRTLGELRDKNGLGLIRITGRSTMNHPNEYAINVGALKRIVVDTPALDAPGAFDAPPALSAEVGALSAKPPALNAPKSSINHQGTIKEKRDKPAPISDSLFPIAQSIAKVCHMDLEANKARIFREAKLLIKASPAPTPELIERHYNGNPAAFWMSHDWRGKRGSLPTPPSIRETWGQWDRLPAPKPSEKVVTAADIPSIEVSPEEKAKAYELLQKRLGKK